MMVYDALIAPFTEFEFMRRALAAVIALSLGGAPIGVFLMLRRMSLVGDAMAHAILPGAAIGRNFTNASACTARRRRHRSSNSAKPMICLNALQGIRRSKK